MKIRLIVVDDHELFLEGLQLRLQEYADEIELLGCAKSQKELQAYIDRNLIPDVLLMDYQLPDTDGIKLVKYVKSLPSWLNVKIVMLSAFQSYSLGESKFDLIIEAIDSEVDGYLLKDSPFEDIVHAIHMVARNECFYIGESIDTRKLTSRVIDDRKRLKSMMRLFRKSFLSERETEVLQQLARGSSAKEIAKNMRLSEDTVTNYKDSIKQKIEEKYAIRLKNVVEMVVWAIKNRIISV